MSEVTFPLTMLVAIATVFSSILAPMPVSAQPKGPELAGFTSAKYDLQYRLETENLAVYVPGSGAFVVNPATGAARATLTLAAFGESLEFRMIDGTMYLKSSTEEDWEVYPASSGGMPPPAMMAELIPPTQMATLQRAVAMTPITTEEVDGVATTRWLVDVDTQSVLDTFSALAGLSSSRSGRSTSLTGDPQLDQMLRSAKLNGLLWVENETGYLKQFQFDLYLNIPTRKDQATGATKEVGVHQQLLVRFHDQDQPVEIVPPPGVNVPARPTPRPAMPLPTAVPIATPRATPTPTPTR